MKLHLPLGLRRAVYHTFVALLTGAVPLVTPAWAADDEPTSGTEATEPEYTVDDREVFVIDGEGTKVYTTPVEGSTDNTYFVKIKDHYHLSAEHVTWKEGHDFGDSGANRASFNVGTSLTKATLILTKAEGATEDAKYIFNQNLFIGCPGWGITSSETYKPLTGEVYVGPGAVLNVNAGSSDPSNSQLNVGAGGDYKLYGHEGVLNVDGGKAMAGFVAASNGYWCKGTINVYNGGSVTAVDGFGKYETGVLAAAYYQGTLGYLNISGGSTATAERVTYIALGMQNDTTLSRNDGKDEAYGYLTVKGDSKADLATLWVGYYGYAHGAITVGDVDSPVPDKSVLTASNAYFGGQSNSSGSLTVQNGATATMGTMNVGYNGGEGTVDVSKGGEVIVSSYAMVGGWSSSSGTLTVSSGGSVDIAGVYIGYDGDASGTVTVDGAGSHADIGWGYIGYSGEGKLNITNGASVDFTSIYDLYVGYGEDSTGEITVSGAASSLNVTGFTVVGADGSGTMDILNGGTATFDNDLLIGNAAEGTVTVGKGASLKVDGGLQVGYNGIGRLTVADGGVLDVSGDIAVGFLSSLTKSNLTLKDGQTLYLNSSAKVEGSVTAVAGSIVELEGSSTITGMLALDGATLVLHGYRAGSDATTDLSSVGMLEVVNGVELVLDGVELGSLATGTYTLMDCGDITSHEGVQVLNAPNGPVTYTLTADEGNTHLQLVVSVDDSATLVEGDQTLGGNNSDAGKDVVIQGGNITVDGTIAPDSVIVQGGGDTTIKGEGSITGDAGLTMNGTGSLDIKTENSYTGGTVVNNGTVNAKVDGALGTGDVVVNEGGTLNGNNTTLGEDQTLTVNGGTVDSLNGSNLVAAGEATSTLKGDNTYSGSVEVQEGAELALGSGATVTTDTLKVTGTVTGGTDAKINAKDIVLEDGSKLDIDHTVADSSKVTVTENSSATVANITVTDGSFVLGSGATVTVADGDTLVIGQGGKLEVTPDTGVLSLTNDKVQVINGLLKNDAGGVVVIDNVENYRNPELVKTDTGIAVKFDSSVLKWQNKDGAVWDVTLNKKEDADYWSTLEDWQKGEQKELDLTDTYHDYDAVVIDSDEVDEGEMMTVDARNRTEAKIVVFQGANKTAFNDVSASSLDAEAFTIAGEHTQVQKWDSGTVVLDQKNEYGGGTQIEDGCIVVDHSEALGKGDVVMVQTSEEATPTLAIAADKKVENKVVVQLYYDEDGGDVYNTATLVNADGAKNIEQKAYTTLNFKNEDGSSGTKTLGVEDTLTIGSSEAVASLFSMMMPFADLNPGEAVVVTESNTRTEDNFTFNGGTLRLAAPNEAYTVGGITTIGTGAVSTVDLGTWAGIDYDTTKMWGVVYCENPLVGAGNANSWIDVELPEELAAYKYYARLTEHNEGSNYGLYLTFVRPMVNDAVASQLTMNQSRAYAALCGIAKDFADGKMPASELTDAASYVGTASAGDVDGVKDKIDGISGAAYATMMSSQIEGNLAHLRRLRGHMGHGHLLEGSKSGLAAYVNGYSELADVDADATGPGYRRSEWGAEVGVEQEIGEGCGIGLALSAGRANVTPTGGVRYHEDSWNLDAYHIIREGAWENRVSIGVGFHEHDLARRGMGGVRATAGNVGGRSFNFMEEIAYYMPVTETVTLRPFFAVESSVNDIDGFAEAGDSLALRGESQNAWATDLTLGVGAETSFAVLSNAPRATFGLHAGVTASVGDTTSDLCMSFAGAPGHSFSQSSADRSRWGMNLGAGVNVPVSRYTSLYATADSVFRSDSVSFDAQLGVHINF